MAKVTLSAKQLRAAACLLGVSEVCPAAPVWLVVDYPERRSRIRLLIRALHRREVTPPASAHEIDAGQVLPLRRAAA